LSGAWPVDGGGGRVEAADAGWSPAADAASIAARFIVVVVVPFLHRSTVVPTTRAPALSSFTCDTYQPWHASVQRLAEIFFAHLSKSE